MKKYPLFLLMALFFCWIPHLGLFEAEERMLLARTISGMAETEPEKVAQMIGEVAINRVQDERFPNDIRSVLNDSRLFYRTATASQRSLRLADALIRGARLLPENVVYFERRESGYVFSDY